MTYRVLSLIVALALLSTNLFAQHSKTRIAHIGLVYPLSTNGIDAKKYTNVFSFHAIAGVSRSETAICASGVSNIIYDRADGAIMAGFSNHILNRASGMQCAGFMNTVRNEAKGLQAAGFLNLSGSMRGMQAAGFCNLTLRNVVGYQTAGFCNLSNGNVRGAQTAGFLNMADTVHGAQLAGFMNLAENVNTQVAGFINVAGKVKGVQVAGFINIADSSDFPIGLVNIVKNGYKGIGVTADESGTVLGAFRSGGRVLYGIVGTGYNFKSDKEFYVMEAGMGARFTIVKQVLNLNVEAVTDAFTNFDREDYLRSSLRILPVVSLGKVELFAGPVISHVISDEFDGSDISNHYVWSHNGRYTFNGIYIGAIAGVQFRF